MNTIIILRGIPGSGKSTLARHLEFLYDKPATICSADNYFYYGKDHTPENYKHSIDKLYDAHKYCQNIFNKAVESKQELIVVDNTNIKIKDYKYYVVTGINSGYEVISHAITGMSPEESFEINIHNTPLSVCYRLYEKFGPCPDPIISKDNFFSIEEIVHDYKSIREGIFENGKFNQKN